MSILRKIPKIEQVLDNMSIESLKRLESLMNSGNGATETYTLFGGENKLNYENKDLGVWYCNIELERNKSVETGFLIWESETKALFISYDITQCLKEYEIDLTNYTFVLINEKLSIEEFRRVLEDNINKEVVHIDTTGNVEIGKNLVVDGKIILNGKEDLVDTSGNVLIGGGGAYWLEIAPYINQETMTISQEGYDKIMQLIENGSIIGITLSGTLPFTYDGLFLDNTMVFIMQNFNGAGTPVSFTQTILRIYSNLQVELTENMKYLVVAPEDASSQIIPSIQANATQENLTIGNGLVIENGALKTTIPPLPADASTKTYTLKAVNGVLTWVEG